MVFYHFDEGKLSNISKSICFWFILLVIILCFFSKIMKNDKVTQRNIRMAIDIKNKINVCMIDEYAKP